MKKPNLPGPRDRRRKGELHGVLGSDLLVFSHRSWDSVLQRPQQLMSRMARHRRVFFVEEPVRERDAGVDVRPVGAGVSVIKLRLREDTSKADGDVQLALYLRKIFETERIHGFTSWYYTPIALRYTRHLAPGVTVYDCTEELSRLSGAPAELPVLERDLMLAADLVFTAGHALFAAKRDQHENMHPFPNGVDLLHFGKARAPLADPPDQAPIPRVRIGFCGVIDERFDAELVAGISALRPGWQIVLLGPVAGFDPASLPRAANIHYLGKKAYSDLPSYLAGWDVAVIPFALNERTRFASPTKTQEYLAAGCPVVSTPLADVVQPFGRLGLVKIAESAEEFVERAEEAMKERKVGGWEGAVDRFLSQTSWDKTYLRMAELESRAWDARQETRALIRAAQETRLGA